jgi:hypothetical protein
MGRVNGALSVDEPHGQRWDLAIEFLNEGPDLIALGPGLLLNRDTAGPVSDGHIHIGVIARAPKEQAQSEVDAAREFVQNLADEDRRFGSLLREFGMIWEYVGDGGTSTVTLAKIGEDGGLIWGDR